MRTDDTKRMQRLTAWAYARSKRHPAGSKGRARWKRFAMMMAYSSRDATKVLITKM